MRARWAQPDHSEASTNWKLVLTRVHGNIHHNLPLKCLIVFRYYFEVWGQKKKKQWEQSVLLLFCVGVLQCEQSVRWYSHLFFLLCVQSAFTERKQSHTHKDTIAHRQQQLEDLPLEQLEPPQPGSHWQVLGAIQRPWTQLSAQNAGHGGDRKTGQSAAQ